MKYNVSKPYFIRFCAAILCDDRLLDKTVTDVFVKQEIWDIALGPEKATLKWWQNDTGNSPSVDELYERSFGSLDRNLTVNAVLGLDFGDNGPAGRDVMTTLGAVIVATVGMRFYS